MKNSNITLEYMEMEIGNEAENKRSGGRRIEGSII